jgi:hypothetical protein
VEQALERGQDLDPALEAHLGAGPERWTEVKEYGGRIWAKIKDNDLPENLPKRQADLKPSLSLTQSDENPEIVFEKKSDDALMIRWRCGLGKQSLAPIPKEFDDTFEIELLIRIEDVMLEN